MDCGARICRRIRRPFLAIRSRHSTPTAKTLGSRCSCNAAVRPGPEARLGLLRGLRAHTIGGDLRVGKHLRRLLHEGGLRARSCVGAR
jgi:hypothetical protein